MHFKYLPPSSPSLSISLLSPQHLSGNYNQMSLLASAFSFKSGLSKRHGQGPNVYNKHVIRTLGHTLNANKRQVWRSAIMEYSRVSASKAKRTRPPLILVDNCGPSAQGKSTKGVGKTHKSTLRMWRYENRMEVIKTCLLCCFFISSHVEIHSAHNLHTHTCCTVTQL